jgi:arylsulfatase A-like enzyme
LIVVCLAVSCGTGWKRPNIVLIGVDTLRCDHVGCYGYGRPTTPNIDRLASQGVIFENAVSQAPWTLPSFATVFTSLYPTQHGAGHVASGTAHFGARMRTSFPPLAMMLLREGYTIGPIVNGPALSSEYGVDRGFEFYNGAKDGKARPADRVTRDALKWIDEHKGKPFFLFVHYFDPHVPYEPPSPYDEMFDPGYRGRVGPGFDRDTYARARGYLSCSGDPSAQADWDRLRALYDGEIAFTDKAIGLLLQGLRARGLKENTLVVFLSDHGEEFFDHGDFEHGHTLYDELLKVPMVISHPGIVPENVRVTAQVRLLDVLPTVLDLLGIGSYSHFQGVSLKELMWGEDDFTGRDRALLPPRFAYSEGILYGSEKKSVTCHPWRLILDTATGERMLDNLKYDPDEQSNLVATQPAKADALEEVLVETYCAMSETWYVEMAGGGRALDVVLTLPPEPVPGRFDMYRLVDSAGNLIEPEGLRIEDSESAGGQVLRFEAILTDQPVTLAVKVTPENARLEFDLRLDGRSVLDLTFLGEALENPGAMPFMLGSAGREVCAGEPGTRPKAPYALTWCSVLDTGADTPVRLAEHTQRSLRALGYIH